MGIAAISPPRRVYLLAISDTKAMINADINNFVIKNVFIEILF